MNYRDVANKVLVAVLVLFIVSAWLKFNYRGLFAAELFFAVMEAALIGGIADWFAVTALFTKPLGFPWHTALIPRNRARLVKAMVEMLEQDLLSVASIQKRLSGLNYVGMFVDWVDNHGGRSYLRDFFNKNKEVVLANIDYATMNRVIKHMLIMIANEKRLTPEIQEALGWLLKQGKDSQLIDFILDELSAAVKKEQTREAVHKYLINVKQSSVHSPVERFVLWLAEQTDSVNLADAADALVKELDDMLIELKNPEHLMRSWLSGKLAEVVEGLDSRPEVVKAIEAWKIETVRRIDPEELLAETVQSGNNLEAAQALIDWLLELAAQYWDDFKQDTQMQEWIEEKIKSALCQLVENEHQLIGKVVEKVMFRFSDDDLARFVEDKAGNDLQWIRINGSVVGGLVGLVIFLFLHFIYLPYAVPAIRIWFF